MTWPCDSDIKSSHICQKAEAALYGGDAIRPHAVKDHDVFFSPLEGIYGIDLDIAELAVYFTEPRAEGILQILNLCLVGCDNSNFARQSLVERPALGDRQVNKANQAQSKSYFVHVDL